MAQAARQRIINLPSALNECEMKDFSAREGREGAHWPLTRDRNDTIRQACGGTDGQAAPPKRSETHCVLMQPFILL